MTKEIIDTILKFVLTGALGYCVSLLKGYRKKTTATNNALKIMLQSNLTNTYFVYSTKKKIPDYVYRNWLNMFKEYKSLKGNDFVDTLANKMDDWEITRTDILGE